MDTAAILLWFITYVWWHLMLIYSVIPSWGRSPFVKLGSVQAPRPRLALSKLSSCSKGDYTYARPTFVSHGTV